MLLVLKLEATAIWRIDAKEGVSSAAALDYLAEAGHPEVVSLRLSSETYR